MNEIRGSDTGTVGPHAEAVDDLAQLENLVRPYDPEAFARDLDLLVSYADDVDQRDNLIKAMLDKLSSVTFVDASSLSEYVAKLVLALAKAYGLVSRNRTDEQVFEEIGESYSAYGGFLDNIFTLFESLPFAEAFILPTEVERALKRVSGQYELVLDLPSRTARNMNSQVAPEKLEGLKFFTMKMQHLNEMLHVKKDVIDIDTIRDRLVDLPLEKEVDVLMGLAGVDADLEEQLGNREKPELEEGQAALQKLWEDLTPVGISARPAIWSVSDELREALNRRRFDLGSFWNVANSGDFRQQFPTLLKALDDKSQRIFLAKLKETIGEGVLERWTTSSRLFAGREGVTTLNIDDEQTTAEICACADIVCDALQHARHAVTIEQQRRPTSLVLQSKLLTALSRGSTELPRIMKQLVQLSLISPEEAAQADVNIIRQKINSEDFLTVVDGWQLDERAQVLNLTTRIDHFLTSVRPLSATPSGASIRISSRVRSDQTIGDITGDCTSWKLNIGINAFTVPTWNLNPALTQVIYSRRVDGVVAPLTVRLGIHIIDSKDSLGLLIDFTECSRQAEWSPEIIETVVRELRDFLGEWTAEMPITQILWNPVTSSKLLADAMTEVTTASELDESPTLVGDTNVVEAVYKKVRGKPCLARPKQLVQSTQSDWGEEVPAQDRMNFETEIFLPIVQFATTQGEQVLIDDFFMFESKNQSDNLQYAKKLVGNILNMCPSIVNQFSLIIDNQDDLNELSAPFSLEEVLVDLFVDSSDRIENWRARYLGYFAESVLVEDDQSLDRDLRERFLEEADEEEVDYNQPGGERSDVWVDNFDESSRVIHRSVADLKTVPQNFERFFYDFWLDVQARETYDATLLAQVQLVSRVLEQLRDFDSNTVDLKKLAQAFFSQDELHGQRPVLSKTIPRLQLQAIA